MKMDIKYQFCDYHFVSRLAFYEGKMLDRSDVIEHLNYWWPELDWDIVSMNHPFRMLVKLLHACVFIAEFEHGVQQG